MQLRADTCRYMHARETRYGCIKSPFGGVVLQGLDLPVPGILPQLPAYLWASTVIKTRHTSVYQLLAG